MRETGEMYSQEVVEGNVGAYQVDDTKYNNYYLVKREGEPVLALETEEIELEGDKFVANKGDWYCEGEWLEKLKRTRGWWTLTGRRYIVRLETVVMSDVRVLERSVNNPLPTKLTGYFTCKVKGKTGKMEHGDCRILTMLKSLSSVMA